MCPQLTLSQASKVEGRKVIFEKLAFKKTCVLLSSCMSIKVKMNGGRMQKKSKPVATKQSEALRYTWKCLQLSRQYQVPTLTLAFVGGFFKSSAVK